jgi:hypothetical protein
VRPSRAGQHQGMSGFATASLEITEKAKVLNKLSLNDSTVQRAAIEEFLEIERLEPLAIFSIMNKMVHNDCKV